MPLRLRRGTDAERLTITPAEGELIYTTDYKKIFVGDGQTIGGRDIVGGISGNLIANVNLNGYTIQGQGNILVTGNVSSTNLLSNGSLTFTGNTVSSSSGYIAVGSGNNIGTVKFGNNTTLLQTQRNWNEPVEPIETQHGITNGFYSLITTRNSSRGTLASPLVVQPGDALTIDRTLGYDGYDYVLSSSIWQGVDPHDAIAPGYVPGAIAFLTEGPTGQNVTAINSRGYLSINKFPAAANEALDVNGNAVISGIVTASAFKGTFVGDDSTTIIDGANGNINGNIIISTALSAQTLNVTTGGFIENRLILRQATPALNILEQYGITDGTNSIINSKCSSRGTFNGQQIVQSGDILSTDRSFGWDGNTYTLASSIQQGVDPNVAVSAGSVPGTITFVTTGAQGTKIVAIDSLGRLSINKFPTAATEALDVVGNGTFTGNVTATGFKGDILADNNDVLIDSATGNLNVSNITASTLAVTYALGGQRVLVRQPVAGQNVFEAYGISNGFYTTPSAYAASRGTIEAPTALNSGDGIASFVSYGHDGTSIVPSSMIWLGHDSNTPITTGSVPGAIRFYIVKPGGGYYDASGFDSYGRLGVLSDTTALRAALDVHGGAVFDGEVNASAFKGSVVADDSTTIIDGVNGNITGNSITSNNILTVLNSTNQCSVQITGYANRGGTGYHDFMSVTNTYGSAVTPNKHFRLDQFGTLQIVDSDYLNTIFQVTNDGHTIAKGYVQFGSFDKTARDALPAVNGMVLYNTTSNRFQGYQNGAWINLDDGSLDP